MLRIGFFPEFKGLNAVLISADSDGMRSLHGAISRIAETPAEAVPVHGIARVSQKHPACLFVTARPPAKGILASDSYYWVLPENARVTAMEFLEPLMSSVSGHQYFDILPATATLVVSVGEYDDWWWERVDA
jgi:hypothetical protein